MAQDDTFGTNPSLIEGGNGVEPLATQVISMLCERQTVTAAGVRQIALDYLSRAILGKNGFDAARALEEMRGFRLTCDVIVDLYIPQAAMQLGDQWMCNDITFAEVTVGALRLQALLGEASGELVWVGQVPEDTLHALVAVPEGEQHFLGASVVAAQLRRSGCDVSLAISETPTQIAARVAVDRPDMVMMSCARVDALALVEKTVKRIKSATDQLPVLAIGGPLRGNADAIKRKTGVDLVTNTASEVVGFCAKRKKALGLR
ncbi:B12-binding domain-containing protein [uncultured Tateyamaria sp.]|uniref:cobalamin B12-binding domain-containing protein n=1 Tax=uncultured Tateyamaria sp. TaxID=455651 RepID=UPI00261DF8BE|nr:cobalamin B12-binding domain-containing protein [uncultured Tateyamaria sp.]